MSRAVIVGPDPLRAVVVQSRTYTFWPSAVTVLTWLTWEAAGRMLDGSAAMVFSAARSWYWLVPALIATQRDAALSAALAGGQGRRSGLPCCR